MTESENSEIDPAVFRDVMGHYPTGVTVVTGFDGDEPVGMVVGTFTSVSLDPPLVAFMPTKGSSTYAKLQNSPAYCINVLAHDQLDVCRTLAGRDPEKFDKVEWTTSEFGAPVVADAVAHIHCVSDQVVEAGDHWIALCRVKGMHVTRPVTPLLFFQGGYGGFTPQAMAAQGDADLIAALRLAEAARQPVERIAQEFKCEAAVVVALGPDYTTTAVSSYGGEASMGEYLGMRLPTVPPFGEAMIAGAKPEVVDHWLAKAWPQTPENLAHLRERLDRIAATGVVVSVIDADKRDEFDQLNVTITDNAAASTPAQDRALRGAISKLGDFSEPVDIQDDKVYDIGSVIVPVHDPNGDVSMTLRMRQLPPGQTGTTIKGWVRALKDAASGVERELRGGASADLEDYLAWYESDFPG